MQSQYGSLILQCSSALRSANSRASARSLSELPDTSGTARGLWMLPPDFSGAAHERLGAHRGCPPSPAAAIVTSRKNAGGSITETFMPA
jgi:hypothetical protein